MTFAEQFRDLGERASSLSRRDSYEFSTESKVDETLGLIQDLADTLATFAERLAA